MTMTTRRALLSVLTALVCVASAGADAYAKDKVVAVLYFDNNTGDNSYDVLKKGFADMMITDLAEVDGITVVERDKLQALLDEIKLQKSPYIDKKTAVKIGKGLGASYAVTGAFAAMKPTLRIDMRMIEISTGKVVVTSKVSGKEKQLFDLEQKLVAKFVKGLKKKFIKPVRPRTKVPDVDTLLDYSKGVDLADKGRYKAASQQMGKVVKRAPTFVMARIKHDQIRKRLETASARRDNVIDENKKTLAKLAADFVKKHKIDKLGESESKLFLAYRILHGRFMLEKLANHVSDKRPHIVLAGHERKAKRIINAHYKNRVKLIKEIAIFTKRFARDYGDGPYVNLSLDLTRTEQKLARESGVESRVNFEARNARVRLAEFLLLGITYDLAGKRITYAPTPSDLDPKLAKVGYRLLKQAHADASKAAKKFSNRVDEAIDALETHADALFLRGKRDEAIAKLQKILDDYPTARQYKQAERRIKQELGMVSSHEVRTLERYARGLQTCKDMDLRVGLATVMGKRVRTAGLDAPRQIIAEIKKACDGNGNAKRFWRYLYSKAGLFYGKHGHCALFESYMQKSVAAGGSRSDVRGYRKNYTKCPLPANP